MFVNSFIPTRRYNYIPYLPGRYLGVALRCVAFHYFSFFFFDYMYISTLGTVQYTTYTVPEVVPSNLP